jgi:sucrose-6-phosphate hydrolase SacC (GH32 family)
MPEHPPATWLTYHLAHPEEHNAPGDPNTIFFWKGRYHLFYIVGSTGVSYAHVSSEDMVRWRWHPTTLSPTTMGHGMFSGTGFLTKEGTPAIIYHGEGSGRNWVALAEDDLLEKWSKPIVVEPRTESGELPEMRHWDPDCWLDGETYYAVSGGQDPHLMKSADLRSWEYLGRLLADNMPDVGVPRDEDISCPNMFRIGDKWMLLCLSHWLGPRYYLGRFENEKYVPETHGLMSGWKESCPLRDKLAEGMFAPESVLTPDGRRVMWAWLRRYGEQLEGVSIQSSIQCLPRELSLPPDGVLRIKPLRELQSLRFDEQRETNLSVPSDTGYVLKGISGDALEMRAVIEPGAAREYGIEVYCDTQGRQGFPIVFHPAQKALALGQSKVPFELKPGERLMLRLFLDKSIIEVFVNDRQAAVAPHKYAPENLGVRLFSRGGDIAAKEVTGWKMHSIYEGTSTFAR